MRYCKRYQKGKKEKTKHDLTKTKERESGKEKSEQPNTPHRARVRVADVKALHMHSYEMKGAMQQELVKNHKLQRHLS